MPLYRPEALPGAPPSPEALRRGAGTAEIFQAMCVKCDEFHNLHLDLGSIRGIIPREEAALGISEGKTGEFSILSRVGKGVCFQVLAFDRNGTVIASRRAAQAAAKESLLKSLRPGDVLPAVVQNPASFGVFCDIGCGVPALMRIDRCCVSRLKSSAELFRSGQSIYAAVLSVNRQAELISLTGRELLGTWEENATRFRPGQTVTGIVRSAMPYGLFVELAPNLSGLAETVSGVQPGDRVSVYIRSILPEKHKLKLNLLQVLPPLPQPPRLEYRVTSGHMERWDYYPGSRTFTAF